MCLEKRVCRRACLPAERAVGILRELAKAGQIELLSVKIDLAGGEQLFLFVGEPVLPDHVEHELWRHGTVLFFYIAKVLRTEAVVDLIPEV